MKIDPYQLLETAFEEWLNQTTTFSLSKFKSCYPVNKSDYFPKEVRYTNIRATVPHNDVVIDNTFESDHIGGLLINPMPSNGKSEIFKSLSLSILICESFYSFKINRFERIGIREGNYIHHKKHDEDIFTSKCPFETSLFFGNIEL